MSFFSRLIFGPPEPEIQVQRLLASLQQHGPSHSRPPSPTHAFLVENIQKFEAIFSHPEFKKVDSEIKTLSLHSWAKLKAALPETQQDFAVDPDLPEQQDKKISYIATQLFLQKEQAIARPHTPPSLPNLGNTCFLNSALKAIFYDSPYQRLLYNPLTQYHNELPENFALRQSLQTTLRTIVTELSKINPSQDILRQNLENLLKNRLLLTLQQKNAFGGREQSDASELLFREILPLLECNDQKTPEFFLTYTTNESHFSLEKPSGRKNLTFSLMLQNRNFLNYLALREGSSVEDALYKFLAPEMSQTQTPDGHISQGERKDLFIKPSDSLLLSLPRFSFVHQGFDETTGRANPAVLGKNTNFILITTNTLSLPICDEKDGSFLYNAIYQLQSAICHVGTLESGHYMAWTHTQDEAAPWVCHNDATTTYHSQEEAFAAISQDGYVLRYKSLQNLAFGNPQPQEAQDGAQEAPQWAQGGAQAAQDAQALPSASVLDSFTTPAPYASGRIVDPHENGT